MTGPPDFLDASGVSCWHRVRTRLMAMGQWEPEYVLGLNQVASQCAHYVRLAKKVRRLKIDCMPVADLDSTLADAHRIARQLLAEFLVIPKSRLLIFALDDDGIDSEISALCRACEPSWTMTT